LRIFTIASTMQDLPLAAPEAAVVRNGLHGAMPGPHGIAGLVAAHTLAAPWRVALAEGDATLTYAALDARTSGLARQLVGCLGGRESAVAVLLPRSADLVVASMAVLKTGAPQTPIDPAAPLDRVLAILDVLDPSVVVTRRGLAARLRGVRWPILTLDDVTAERGTKTALDPHPAPGDVACAIYTPRALGRPTALEVTHGELLEAVHWQHATLGVTAGDRVALLFNPGFAAFVWEAWPCLAAGASLHVPDETVRMDAEALRDWLIAQDITLAFVPAALAAPLRALPWPTAIRLRALLTGADTPHRRPVAERPFAREPDGRDGHGRPAAAPRRALSGR
jgi:non-ribosomal peptide synthetase component F